MATIHMSLETWMEMQRLLGDARTIRERAKADGLSLADKLALIREADALRERALALR